MRVWMWYDTDMTNDTRQPVLDDNGDELHHGDWVRDAHGQLYTLDASSSYYEWGRVGDESVSIAEDGTWHRADPPHRPIKKIVWSDASQPAPPTDLLARAGDGPLCNRCGQPNIQWYAPSPLWNAVMRGGDINAVSDPCGIVCMTCFVDLAEARGVVSRGSWVLDAEIVDIALMTITPSGRTWSSRHMRWIDSVEVR